MKSLALALVASPLLASAAPEEPLIVNYIEVVQIRCDQGVGSGVRYKTHGILSVNHVTRMTNCKVDGVPIATPYANEALDFSVSRSPVVGQGAEIDCGGFKEGEIYAAIGYASGLPVQRMLFAKSSAAAQVMIPWGSFSAFLTPVNFIPGMSGGPVVNEAGKVVGVVKGFYSTAPVSYARALKDTPLCSN